MTWGHLTLYLRKIIENLSGYRFTGSSLLVIYDGSAMDLISNHVSGSNFGSNSSFFDKITEILLVYNLVDVKMVDFAKSTLPGFLEDNPFRGPDEGYLFGLNSLILIVNQTLSKL